MYMFSSANAAVDGSYQWRHVTRGWSALYLCTNTCVYDILLQVLMEQL